jgi:hypothetical protein
MYYSGTGLPTVDPSGFVASQIVMYDMYHNCLARIVTGSFGPLQGKTLYDTYMDYYIWDV